MAKLGEITFWNSRWSEKPFVILPKDGRPVAYVQRRYYFIEKTFPEPGEGEFVFLEDAQRTAQAVCARCTEDAGRVRVYHVGVTQAEANAQVAACYEVGLEVEALARFREERARLREDEAGSPCVKVHSSTFRRVWAGSSEATVGGDRANLGRG